ncbi:MAG TPA: patatin-like phospholipase family protein [Edaphocola sp.]|nr:patatin-like phospholipase family protein [Edaphocola sp.]
MAGKRFNFYRFLPVQLFLLHFRKYQLLLLFWLVLFSTVSGNFMAHFGAGSLFLAPEYLGRISWFGFFLLGGATAIFTMSWHITTFIIHSKRVPFLGATRHAFVKYCLNNSVIPLIYLITYSIYAAHYLYQNENYIVMGIVLVLLGFYMGYVLILLASFLYFFRVDRNILKTVLSGIGNLTAIKDIIPFDTLDIENDQIYAHSYLNSMGQIRVIKRPYQYNTRFLAAVLRRHHRNAVFAIVIAYILLLILGVFMEQPILRVPAGSGFLLLFSIIMAFVGSFKYLLRSWEIIGWITLFAVVSLLTYKGVFDLRSVAYGLSYSGKERPEYSYQNLSRVFDTAVIEKDKKQEKQRLNCWAGLQGQERPAIVVISASGGGSRSAYWTFRCLQYADSLTGGQLFKHTVLITGASGGMIGAAFWRAIHTENLDTPLKNIYSHEFQKDIGEDLLNAIVFSMATVDFISPFNKIIVNGNRYGKDRGYAFDQELGHITGGLLDKTIGDYQRVVARGRSPMMIVSGTIINDGRKLMMSSQPISYLTRAGYNADDKKPVIDAVDFGRFFSKEDPMKLKLASALRMSATFPVILPVVKLPARPDMNIMDAGLRDNYGMETSLRYLHSLRTWMLSHCGNIIFLQIRDTREAQPEEPDSKLSFREMISDPLFAIQQKWSSFQTFSQTYLQDDAYDNYPAGRFHKIILEFEPRKKERNVALNFHLSDQDKKELLQSVYGAGNQKAFARLQVLLQQVRSEH